MYVTAKTDSFEEFYYRYRQDMYAVAYSILNNTADAEDAVSKTFMKISVSFEKIVKIPPNEIRAYITVITRNTALDIYKGNKRRMNHIEELDDKKASVDINLLERYESEQLIEAIRELPKKYKDIIFLRYLENFTVKEISSMLSISAAAVWKRAERAKKMLKEIIERKGL